MVGISKTYIDKVIDGKDVLQEISFKNAENFNFAYDIVDVMAERDPDKMCMLWVDPSRNERRFTFKEISDYSTKTANYFMDLGIKKGDRVMLLSSRRRSRPPFRESSLGDFPSKPMTRFSQSRTENPTSSSPWSRDFRILAAPKMIELVRDPQ